MKNPIVEYINCFLELNFEDIVNFAKEAQKPNRHVVCLSSMDNYYLDGGAAMVYESKEKISDDVLKEFLIKEFE